MERADYLRQFWRVPDEEAARLLGFLERRSPALRLELQGLLDKAARLGFDGRLSGEERRRLREAVDARRFDTLELCGPVAAALEYGAATASQRGGLELLFLLVWLGFFDDVEGEAVDRLTAAAERQSELLQAPRPPARGEVKRWLAQPMVDGTLFDADLQARALYAARQMVRRAEALWRQGLPLTLAAPPIKGLLAAEGGWLLRRSAKGAPVGFLDVAMANIIGHTVLRAYRDRGVREVEFVAVLDGSTTEECRRLDGRRFSIDALVLGKNAPPIFPPPHPCRSALRIVSQVSPPRGV